MTSPYVSTTVLPRPLRETLSAFEQIDVERVELGYCNNTSEEVVSVINEYDFEFAAHNYFHPVADEFIINLASENETIRQRSIEYLQNCLDVCAATSIDNFTFHAGFRVDPSLSLDFSTSSMTPRKVALDLFFESLTRVSRYAKNVGVEIAIENNVVTRENVLDGDSKLLFCRLNGLDDFLDRLPGNVGVLLDTGHLNVSAQTFDFDRMAFIDRVSPHVKWLHLHRNDGTADQHLPPTMQSWPMSIYRNAFDSNISATLEATFENKTDLEAYLRTQW